MDRGPELADLEQAQGVAFMAPLAVEVALHRVGGEQVEMRGRLDTRLRLTCRRCLEPFEKAVSAAIHLVYEPEPEASTRWGRSASLELSADDLGLMFFAGDAIDTTEAVREAALATLPMQPLCRPDCKGLCARCGTNLNEAACACSRREMDPRLAVLAKLKTPAS